LLRCKYILVKTQKKIIVLAVPQACPGALEDQPKIGQILRFNKELQRYCLEKGYTFADPTDDLFDYEKLRVKTYFRSKPEDFHCSFQRIFYFYHRTIEQATSGLKWCGT
jgi:hypothetical protein